MNGLCIEKGLGVLNVEQGFVFEGFGVWASRPASSLRKMMGLSEKMEALVEIFHTKGQ